MQKKFIINEKQFAEDLISSNILPEDISANTAILYMTRYYYEYEKLSLEEIIKKVCNKMESFKLSVTVYQEYKASARIKRIYTALENNNINNLRDCNNIPLYKSEYNKIMQCETDREKKILFTLYIISRFTNRYGWVYNPESEIYKLANVSSTTKNKIDVYSSLLHKGLIKDTKKVDDLKVGVELSNGNEEIILEISEIKSLGNQFIAFIKDNYITCKECGKLVKIKSKYDGSTKYCEKCAKEINKKKTKNNMKALRDRQET